MDGDAEEREDPLERIPEKIPENYIPDGGGGAGGTIKPAIKG